MTTNKIPHRVAVFTSFSTVLLLVAGALVTSTGSGLSVPDWPLSFGTLFPEMTGGVFYEHGHRLIAGGVAILTVCQMMVFLKWESRPWVRRLSVLAVVIVLSQALLGGLTVLMRLPPQVSVAHACLAQLYFCSVVTLGLVTSRSWQKNSLAVERANRSQLLATVSVILTIGFFFQLLAGAIMRHTGAGLAIPDFPLMFGGLIPSEFNEAILIHFIHRMLAYTLTLVSLFLVAAIFRRYPAQLNLIMWGGGLLTLLSVQIMLGANVILMARPVMITSLHLAVGALCFATSLVLCLKLGRLAWGSMGFAAYSSPVVFKGNRETLIPG